MSEQRSGAGVMLIRSVDSWNMFLVGHSVLGVVWSVDWKMKLSDTSLGKYWLGWRICMKMVSSIG